MGDCRGLLDQTPRGGKLSHLISRPISDDRVSLTQTSTVGNHLYLADQDDNGNIVNVGSHLACFMAGNWIMGELVVAFLTSVGMLTASRRQTHE